MNILQPKIAQARRILCIRIFL